MAALMMSTPNAYALALEVYDQGPQGLAWMEAVTAGGMILGGLLAGRRNYQGDLNLYVLESVLLMGAASLLVGLMPVFWAAVACLAVGAVANVAMVVGSITLYQSIDERPERGRIIALRTGAGQLGAMVGLLAGGALGAVLGVKPAFVVMGLAGMLLVLLVYAPYLLGRRGGAAPDRLESPPTGAAPLTTSDR
jgi:MFS family permease